MDAFTKFRGDDWSFTIAITETVDGVTTPMNVTGATITAVIDVVPSVAADIAVIDAVNGQVRVDVAKAKTAVLALKDYICEVATVQAGKDQVATQFRIRVLARVPAVAV